MRIPKMAIVAALAVMVWGRGACAAVEESIADDSNGVEWSASGENLVASDYRSAEDSEAAAYADSQTVSYLGEGGSCVVDPSCGCGNGCTGCGDCGCGPNCFPLADLGEAYSLFTSCCMEERGITAGGWLAQSYTWNPYNPTDKFNGPVTWTDRANEYQMNELWMYLGKPANTEGCGWDYGYRFDAMYGSNYRWVTAAGLETDINGHDFYGLALPQFYGELAYNDLTVKAGHWLSPVGFYAVGTPNNFFPVLPYTFQYGEPFTHTGALATYRWSDKLTTGTGFTRGWDNFDNSGNPNLGYISTWTYTRDNGDTLAYVGLYGREPNLSGVNGGLSNRYLHTLVYTMNVSDDVTGVLQSDYGTQEDGVRQGQRADWYGLNSYLYWRMTCRMQWGLNMEWFRDENGFRVGQALPSLGSPDARGWSRGPGFAGNFYVLTVGPRYFITPNLYARTAARFDWYDGANPGGVRPFDDGTKSHQQIGVFDLVWTF